jgi:uncharacterized repeat protein (TIGR01451 family)
MRTSRSQLHRCSLPHFLAVPSPLRSAATSVASVQSSSPKIAGGGRAVALRVLFALLTVIAATAMGSAAENVVEVWREEDFSASCVSVNPTDGSCWVADTTNDQVVHLSSEGAELWRGGQFGTPMSVSVNSDDGSCWVSDVTSGEDYIVHLSSAGTEVWRGGGFNVSWSVSVNAADGSCWVANKNGNSVIHLSSTGAELWRGFIDYPFSVSVNSTDGSCWVGSVDADSSYHHVVHLSSDGTQLHAPGGFDYPWSVSVNATDGSCWVADSSNNEVVHLSAEGEELWRGGGFYAPHSVSVNPTDGSCWVADTVNSEVVHLSAEGQELWRGGEGFFHPESVSVNAADGSCWVAGSGYVAHLVIDTTTELSLTISADRDAARLGEDVVFTLSYGNSGPLGAVNVVLANPLDPLFDFVSGTGDDSYDSSTHIVAWDLGDLEAGYEGEVTLTVRVAEDAPIGSEITNKATLSADNADPVTSNTVTVTVIPDIDPEPPVQTNYWDFSATGMLGAKASLGTPDLLETAFSAKAVEVYGEVEGGAGLRYELTADDTGDTLELTRSHSGGLKGGVELGSWDALGVVEGHLAAVERGGRVQHGVTYTFDDPYADDHQAQAIIALTVADLVEMGGTVSPLLGGPIVALLLENSIQGFTADDRTAERTEVEGFFDVGLPEIHVGNEQFSLSGALDDALVGFGGVVGGYAETRFDAGVVTGYENGMYGSGHVSGGVLPLPALYGQADRGTFEYGAESDAQGVVQHYVAQADVQDEQGFGIFWESQAYSLGRYRILASHASGLLGHVSGTPLGQVIIGDVITLATLGTVLGDQFTAAHGGILSYSEDQGITEVGDYALTTGEAQVHAFDLSISLPATSGFANLTPKVGIGASAITGWEHTTETGSISDGSLVPEHIYSGTPIAPSYEGYEGFVDMMGVILTRALTSVVEDLWEQLMPQLEAIAAGAEETIDALGAAGEGATQLIVDASEFGEAVAAGLTSFGSDVAGVIFVPSAAPEAALPYRSDTVISIASLLTDDEILTLVGRTHHVHVEGASGAVSTFPTGGVRLRTTVLREQVLAAGLPAEAFDSVTLYHYLPDTATWEEMAVIVTSATDGVTLESILYEPGEYAPGVVRLRSEPGMPEIVNIRPIHHEMVSGPTVTLSAIVQADAGWSTGVAVMTLDGETVTELSPSLSSGGKYLSVEKSVSLEPGLHRLSVSATDSTEQRVTRSCNFYVDREYTFPDVPPQHWAWRHVEATKLGGVVGGYPDGNYYPDNAVTRGQMAVFVSRAMAGGDTNVPDSDCAEPPFTDVDCDHWARRYIQYLVDCGIVGGYPEGDYKPDLAVDRGQMAAYIARALLGCGGGEPPDLDCAEPVFPDVDCDFWAWKYVEYIRAAGVTGGYDDGLYHPERICTRDQMAVYVARAFDLGL